MLTANRVIQELKKCGITHVVWLPDSETRFMYETLAADPQITLIPVCREGEALTAKCNGHVFSARSGQV